MNAAIYARKSTDQAGIGDEAKSVTRQIDHARAYAATKGWTVDEAHVYTDDGISGALFGDKRPGLARLLNTLHARPAFDVLIMSEESRLGREAIETGWTLKQIIDAGVRVFFYLSDQERTVDSAMDKVMLSLTNFASEMERERAGQRTHDALIRKARAGHVANGAVFGYRNVRTPEGPVTREIVATEADTIRRIFAMVAAGTGFRRIAIALNGEGVPGPISRRPGYAGGWAPSTVRSLVLRDLYRGVSVWNKAQRIVRGGTRKKIDRRPSEWITVPVPAPRIVTEEAWKAAHARLAVSRETYLATNRGQRFGRPVNGLPSRYLLTGFGACGVCGSSMFVARTPHLRDRCRPYFGCVGYHQRGRAICTNNLTAPLGDVDQAVLKALEHDLLRVEVFETSLAKALETLRQGPADQRARRQALREQLARLEAESGRLTTAIATGGDLPALVAALQERERLGASLRAELAVLERTTRRREIDEGRVLRTLRASLAEWRATLRQNVSEARKVLGALLAGRLVFTPQDDDAGRFYAFEGPGTVSKIITGLALPNVLMTS